MDPFGLERGETTEIFEIAKILAEIYIQHKYEEIVGLGTTSYGYNESIAAGALIGRNHQITYEGKGNIAFQMVVNVGTGFPGVSISGYKLKSNAQDVMGTEGHGAYTYTYTVVRYNIWTGKFYFGNTN